MPDLVDTLSNTDWSSYDWSKLPWVRMGIAAAAAAVLFPAHRMLAVVGGALVGAFVHVEVHGHGKTPCGCSGAATPPMPPMMTAPGPSSGTGGLDDPGALLSSSVAAGRGMQ